MSNQSIQPITGRTPDTAPIGASNTRNGAGARALADGRRIAREKYIYDQFLKQNPQGGEMTDQGLITALGLPAGSKVIVSQQDGQVVARAVGDHQDNVSVYKSASDGRLYKGFSNADGSTVKGFNQNGQEIRKEEDPTAPYLHQGPQALMNQVQRASYTPAPGEIQDTVELSPESTHDHSDQGHESIHDHSDQSHESHYNASAAQSPEEKNTALSLIEMLSKGAGDTGNGLLDIGKGALELLAAPWLAAGNILGGIWKAIFG